LSTFSFFPIHASQALLENTQMVIRKNAKAISLSQKSHRFFNIIKNKSLIIAPLQ
jgi:hypothetical protein